MPRTRPCAEVPLSGALPNPRRGSPTGPKAARRHRRTRSATPNEGVLPSDQRFRFLSQGFAIAGLMCVILGAIWAWQNWMIRSEHPATTGGVLVRTSSACSRSTVALPGGPDQPLGKLLQPRLLLVKDAWYAYVVDRAEYYAAIPDVELRRRSDYSLRSAMPVKARRRINRRRGWSWPLPLASGRFSCLWDTSFANMASTWRLDRIPEALKLLVASASHVDRELRPCWTFAKP